jgi:hypothetical protein
MQSPASLNIIGRLPPIDAVIAKEIDGQFTYCDSLVYRPDKGVGADLSEAFTENASR